MDFKLKIPSLKSICLLKYCNNLLNENLDEYHREADLKTSMDVPMLWGLSAVTKAITKLPPGLHNNHGAIPKTLQCDLLCVLADFRAQMYALWNDCNRLQVLGGFPFTVTKLYFGNYGFLRWEKVFEDYVEEIYSMKNEFLKDLKLFFCSIASWCVEKYISIVRAQLSKEEIAGIATLNKDDIFVIYWLFQEDDCMAKLIHCNGYDVNHSVFDNLMSYALKQGLSPAVIYCWNKLIFDEKQNRALACALFAAPRHLTELLCASMSFLSTEQVKEVCENFASAVVMDFLHLPCCHLFLNVFEIVMPYLCIREFNAIFENLIYYLKMCQNPQCIHKKLIIQLSEMCSLNFKNAIVNQHPTSATHFALLMNDLYRIDINCHNIILQNLILKENLSTFYNIGGSVDILYGRSDIV